MSKFPRIFLFLLFLGFSSASNAADTAFFDTTFGDFTEELEVAEEEGKKGILIFFEMEECPFCHRMKGSVLNQPDVIDYFKKHFRIFQVDIEGDIEMTDFDGNLTTQKDFAFKQHRVRATPVIAFFDLSGQRMTRYTGATASKEEFLLLGEYVVDDHYKQTSFTRFKREMRKPQ